MDTELKKMVKRVVLADIVIAIIIGVFAILRFKQYVFILIFGLMLALINFLLNTVISNYVVMQGGNKSLNLLGSVFRIVITLVLAVILCGNDKNKYIATLVGYTFHYFAIIFYGLTAREQIERK